MYTFSIIRTWKKLYLQSFLISKKTFSLKPFVNRFLYIGKKTNKSLFLVFKCIKALLLHLFKEFDATIEVVHQGYRALSVIKSCQLSDCFNFPITWKKLLYRRSQSWSQSASQFCKTTAPVRNVISEEHFNFPTINFEKFQLSLCYKSSFSPSFLCCPALHSTSLISEIAEKTKNPEAMQTKSFAALVSAHSCDIILPL